MHPGVDRKTIKAATGWPVLFADDVMDTPPPTKQELETLREYYARTEAAHGSETGKTRRVSTS